MRDMKRAFDERNTRAAPAAQMGYGADAAALRAELEQVRRLAQHALDLALGASEGHKTGSQELRAQVEALRSAVEQHSQHLSEVAALAARIAQPPASPAPQPSVRSITIEHDKNGRISGATVKEG